MDALKFVPMLERHRTNLQESYERLKLDKDKIKNMMSDLQELKNMYETFEKNYGYRIREVYGCLYELQDCNSPYYRNEKV